MSGVALLQVFLHQSSGDENECVSDGSWLGKVSDSRTFSCVCGAFCDGGGAGEQSWNGCQLNEMVICGRECNGVKTLSGIHCHLADHRLYEKRETGSNVTTSSYAFDNFQLLC